MLVVGGILSLTLFATIRGWERKEIAERAGEEVRVQVEKLQIAMLRSMEVLHSISSLYLARGELSRSEFRQFTEQALQRQPELAALSWNPLVGARERTKLEAGSPGKLSEFQIKERDAAGHLIRAGERSEYVPVYLIEPLGANAVAVGYDLNSDPRRHASLERARDTGLPVTKPLVNGV